MWLRLLAAGAFTGALCGQIVPLDWRAVLNRIQERSVRAHVRFLASDLLEGRATPSPGLDIAASYIAAQFERAGLEPMVDGSYFHDTPLTVRQPAEDGFALSIRVADRVWSPRASQVRYYADAEVDYRHIPAAVVPLAAGRGAPDVDPGRAVILVLPEGASFESLTLVREAMSKLQPAIAVIADPSGAVTASGMVNRPRAVEDNDSPPPRLIVNDHDLADALRALPPNAIADLSLRARPAPRRTFPLRNVLGVLRGSDPVLRDTYVFVSAHYDHVGGLGPGTGDRVFNGANDNASGTAAVLELAEAFSMLPVRPKRSMVFCAFAAEEAGLLGSRRLLAKAPMRLESIVAAINLEVLGRTDAPEGSQAGRAAVTGFDFTGIGEVLAAAGKDTGIEIYRHPEYSDAFFDRSDNLSFAEKGIPAHTVATAFLYPDYHTPADDVTKIDAAQIVRVSRAVALAVLRIADEERAPEWDRSKAGAEKYWKAREKGTTSGDQRQSPAQ
jgi:hypothetical protein